MSSMSDKIIKRISSHGNDRWVCTPKDFLDLGSRKSAWSNERGACQGLLRNGWLFQNGQYRRTSRPVPACRTESHVVDRKTVGLRGSGSAVARSPHCGEGTCRFDSEASPPGRRETRPVEKQPLSSGLGTAPCTRHHGWRGRRRRMKGRFESFPALSAQDKRDLIEAAATRCDTLPRYVEKDF